MANVLSWRFIKTHPPPPLFSWCSAHKKALEARSSSLVSCKVGLIAEMIRGRLGSLRLRTEQFSRGSEPPSPAVAVPNSGSIFWYAHCLSSAHQPSLSGLCTRVKGPVWIWCWRVRTVWEQRRSICSGMNIFLLTRSQPLRTIPACCWRPTMLLVRMNESGLEPGQPFTCVCQIYVYWLKIPTLGVQKKLPHLLSMMFLDILDSGGRSSAMTELSLWDHTLYIRQYSFGCSRILQFRSRGSALLGHLVGIPK